MISKHEITFIYKLFLKCFYLYDFQRGVGYIQKFFLKAVNTLVQFYKYFHIFVENIKF